MPTVIISPDGSREDAVNVGINGRDRRIPTGVQEALSAEELEVLDNAGIAYDELPEALSVSDFENGTYTLGGEAKTFAQMWEANPYFGTGAPPIEPTPGVGIVVEGHTTISNDMAATAAHMAGLNALADLTAGITMMIDIQLIQGTPGYQQITKPRIAVQIFSADEMEGWMFYQNGSTHHSVSSYNNFYSQTAPDGQGPLGDIKWLATLAPDGLRRSYNGNPIVRGVDGTESPDRLSNAGGLVVSPYMSHTNPEGSPPSRVTLRSFTLYPKMPDIFLPLLSDIPGD